MNKSPKATPMPTLQRIIALSLLPLLPLLATFSVLLLMPNAAKAQAEEDHKPRNLTVLNHITGWHLDGAGYHPAVYMLLENISGRDLSGVTIKMQGKFTDIHTLEPSTAKLEIRRTLKPHQQFPIALLAPQGFELPRDPNVWPVMECKVMIRVGQTNDEGTEYLLVTKIDAITATQDDSFQKLNEVTSYNRSHHHSTPAPVHHPSNHSSKHEGSRKIERPAEALVATAEKLKPPSAISTPRPAVAASGTLGTLTSKGVPGLGDDFYNFEKVFGMPVATDAKKKDFTWAKFRQAASGTEIIVASKERTGKADLIAFTIPKSEASNDQRMIDQLKSFAGIKKTVKLGPPNRSVRYLPAGRLELTSADGPGLKIMSMSVPSTADHPASTLIMITRLPGEPDELLRSHVSGNDVLHSLPIADHPSVSN